MNLVPIGANSFLLENPFSEGPQCAIIVRLSLLTMTRPNQLCDVLLFVCSKMADETNLSSKLPVEIEQERAEE